MSVNENARPDFEGTIRIVFRRAFDSHRNLLRGQYIASLGPRDLCISSNPFVAANILLAEGVDPESPVAGRPVEAGYDLMTMTVGAAANLRIEDSSNVVQIFRRRET